MACALCSSFVAGGIAGTLSFALLHPIDVLKSCRQVRGRGLILRLGAWVWACGCACGAHCRSELARRSLHVYSHCVQMGVGRVLGRELTAPCDVQRGDGVVTSVRVLIVDATVTALTLILCGGAGGARPQLVALAGNHQ